MSSAYAGSLMIAGWGHGLCVWLLDNCQPSFFYLFRFPLLFVAVLIKCSLGISKWTVWM